MYEVLELFAYEVDADAESVDGNTVAFRARLMTVLISAIGKLGARYGNIISLLTATCRPIAVHS